MFSLPFRRLVSHGSRPSRLTALLLASVLGILWIPSTLIAQQQPHNADIARVTQKQLSLRNTTKDTIAVELRLGDKPDCAANPPARTQSVPPGREWLIATPRPICWRRSDAKAPAGVSSWHRHVLRSGEHLKLTI